MSADLSLPLSPLHMHTSIQHTTADLSPLTHHHPHSTHYNWSLSPSTPHPHSTHCAVTSLPSVRTHPVTTLWPTFPPLLHTRTPIQYTAWLTFPLPSLPQAHPHSTHSTADLSLPIPSTHTPSSNTLYGWPFSSYPLHRHTPIQHTVRLTFLYLSSPHTRPHPTPWTADLSHLSPPHAHIHLTHCMLTFHPPLPSTRIQPFNTLYAGL